MRRYTFVTLLAIVSSVSCGHAGSSVAPQKPALKRVIKVSLRRSLLDSSKSVLQIINMSQSELKNLIMIFTNIDSKQERFYKINSMSSGEQKEIGMFEANSALCQKPPVFLRSVET